MEQGKALKKINKHKEPMRYHQVDHISTAKVSEGKEKDEGQRYLKN